MKIHRFFHAAASARTFAWTSAGALLISSIAASAATEVRVWHSLNPHNKKVFEDLVKDFNKEQKDITVVLKAFDNEDAIEAALAASKKRDDKPQLVQLDDNRSPDEVAGRSYIQPLHTLLAKYPIKDAKWFLADENTFMRDTKGRLLAFPYMVDVPVMFYNVDAFKKANIKPAVPQRSWSGLQDQLVTLANNGSRRCPLTTDQPVTVNLESLGPINNHPYTNNDNGLKAKAKATPAFVFDMIYVRHLSMMISWVRSELMVKPELDGVATKRFANRECAVLMSDSSNLGWFKEAGNKLDVGVTGLPYYPQFTPKPGNPFVGGSALWVTSTHSKESDAGTAKFLGWLAQPKRAAYWYQNTGYLPLTQQAFAQTDKGYFASLGDWQDIVASYSHKPGPDGRGFKVNNYPQIRAMFGKTLDKALNGNEPAVTALRSASTEASKIMRQP
jgi:multiple sugar transport system substrate-binding protein